MLIQNFFAYLLTVSFFIYKTLYWYTNYICYNMHKHLWYELRPTRGLFLLCAHDNPMPPMPEALPIMIFSLLSLFFHYYFPYYYFPTTIFLLLLAIFSITKFSTAICHSRTPSTNWFCQGNGKMVVEKWQQ